MRSRARRQRELPRSFDGFTILHISDMHVEMNEGAMRHLIELVEGLRYDLCVLTGDYRAKTFGPFDATLKGVASVRDHIRGPIYGVLGNHDTIQMIPGLEAMGIRMLLNECETIVRGDQQIYLAGIDDAHFFRVDNIEKAGSHIPNDAFSVLLTHTPEIYRQAAHAGFIPYGPTNRQAFKHIKADVAARLPSAPEQKQKAFLHSAQWWADNRSKVSERWSQWLLQKS